MCRPCTHRACLYGDNQIYLFFAVMVQPNCCQRISSSIRNGQLLCPGEEIVLTCEIRNELFFRWRNYDYIGGQNGAIKFAFIDEIGTTHRSLDYNTTFANLTRNDFLVNESLVFESELHLTTRADVSSTSVICVSTKSSTFTLRLRGTIIINVQFCITVRLEIFKGSNFRCFCG